MLIAGATDPRSGSNSQDRCTSSDYTVVGCFVGHNLERGWRRISTSATIVRGARIAYRLGSMIPVRPELLGKAMAGSDRKIASVMSKPLVVLCNFKGACGPISRSLYPVIIALPLIHWSKPSPIGTRWT